MSMVYDYRGSLTPAEIREYDRRRRSASRHRAKQRAQTPPVELTVETLLAALDWNVVYATHRVQPYCQCYDQDHCAHWYDERKS